MRRTTSAEYAGGVELVDNVQLSIDGLSVPRLAGSPLSLQTSRLTCLLLLLGKRLVGIGDGRI
jgi:hypothetical protein